VGTKRRGRDITNAAADIGTAHVPRDLLRVLGMARVREFEISECRKYEGRQWTARHRGVRYGNAILYKHCDGSRENALGLIVLNARQTLEQLEANSFVEEMLGYRPRCEEQWPEGTEG